MRTPFVSDTKELAWHLSADSKGLVTLETERNQALIGFVNVHRKGLRNLALDFAWWLWMEPAVRWASRSLRSGLEGGWGIEIGEPATTGTR